MAYLLQRLSQAGGMRLLCRPPRMPQLPTQRRALLLHTEQRGVHAKTRRSAGEKQAYQSVKRKVTEVVQMQ